MGKSDSEVEKSFSLSLHGCMKPTNMRFEFSYLLHSINLRKYGHDSTANIHTQVLSWQALHHTTNRA